MDKNVRILVLVGVGGVGVYLLYKGGYLKQWFPALFPSPKAPAPVTTNSPAVAPPASTTGAPAPAPVPSRPPVLDMTGLTVVRDINDSFTGTVKINGTPTLLAIIQTDGRIFDSSGSEVTSQLQAEGVDINALRAAFTHAGAGLAGLGWAV